MGFLFSSDFHSHEPAFQAFAHALRLGPYDAGILAGDLLDEWLPETLVDRLVGHGDTASPAARLAEALLRRRDELVAMLEAAGKPIFYVLGNHDVTPWPDNDRLINLHGRRVEFHGRWLAGYRWTRMDRYPHELEADVPELERLVDDETLLVTHSPPHGVLDGLPGARFRFGLKTLHRLTPRLHLFGHVHECAGVEGRAVNGAWPAARRFFAVDPDRASATWAP